MMKLTNTQKAILEAAIGHVNGSIHPLPTNVKGGAAQKVIGSLLQKGLVEEDGYKSWRITEQGLRAIGLNLSCNMDPSIEEDVALAEQSFTKFAN